MNLDRLITVFDNSLRTLFAPAHSARPYPAEHVEENELGAGERDLVVALVRVDHTGEICAQALYQGQSLTSRDAGARAALERAAAEETDHLAWTARRIDELGGRLSLLNPIWYAGSFVLGATAGLLGDKWNLGFLAETERQVEAHLASHLERLPLHDRKSRAVLEQMKEDEVRHACNAVELGGTDLPEPVKLAMKIGASVMTRAAFRI